MSTRGCGTGIPHRGQGRGPNEYSDLATVIWKSLTRSSNNHTPFAELASVTVCPSYIAMPVLRICIVLGKFGLLWLFASFWDNRNHNRLSDSVNPLCPFPSSPTKSPTLFASNRFKCGCHDFFRHLCRYKTNVGILVAVDMLGPCLVHK